MVIYSKMRANVLIQMVLFLIISNTIFFNQECNAYIFSDKFGYTLPVQWNLVCNRSFIVVLLNLSVSLGMVFACFWSGMSADRLGRKTTASICCILNIVTEITSLFVANVYVYILCRFFISMFNIAMFSTSFLLELVDVDKRFMINMITPLCFIGGVTSLSGIYAFFQDWFKIHVYYGCINGPVCFLLLRCLNKSPSWMNQSTHLDIHFANPRDDLQMDRTKRRKSSAILMIIRDRTIRMKSVALYFLSFSSSAIFYGININAKAYNPNIYIYLPIYNSGFLPAILTIIVFKKYNVNKKYTIIVNLFLSTAIFIALPFYQNRMFSMICIMMGIYLISINTTYGYMLTPYQYPVSLRGSGVSYFMLCSRLGVVLGASLLYIQTNTVVISVIYSILCTITGILVMYHIPILSPYEHENENTKLSLHSDDSGLGTHSSRFKDRKKPPFFTTDRLISENNQNLPQDIKKGGCIVVSL
ncbi:hypothetical protein A3Q56_05018 [Intoshia linei]|uniref:Major facilitator superfamily (MFS) profile domain-containing protein n=1 Tax=Intoshia linei TaxID=1819745 RepID=A0A177AZ19_9BILA|nr:hypothetical protein A3Q56_05018 [Intoshia linei]